jgi:hypothetical protein
MRPLDMTPHRTPPHLSHLSQWLTLLAWLLLSAATTAAAQTSKSYGQGLGRLITTEFERAKLDEARFNVAPPKIYEGPPQLEIQGISQRPGRPKGQDITIWIDRRAYAERELPTGLKLVRDKNGEITGMTSRQPSGKLEFAKIGDFISRPQTKEEASAQAQAELEAKSNAAASSPKK